MRDPLLEECVVADEPTLFHVRADARYLYIEVEDPDASDEAREGFALSEGEARMFIAALQKAVDELVINSVTWPKARPGFLGRMWSLFS